MPKANPTQVIFITGGASGLGRAIALRWAREGWRVAIADLNNERGAEVQAEIEALGAEAAFYQVDVREEAQLQTAAQSLLNSWGRVDVVVNNAGIATGGPIDDHELEDWQAVLDINLMGVVRGCRVFTPIFKQQGSGYFINTASLAGLIHPPRMASYNASKAAVVAVSETLSFELDADGIGVSVVCPSFFNTNLGESLRSNDPNIGSMMAKLFKNAKFTADDVANACWDAMKKRQFYVLPYRDDKAVFQMKRLLPFKRYRQIVLVRSAAMMK